MLAGEMYHVSLYDSASEDDAGCTDTDVLMTLSDRLIQEITLSGHVCQNKQPTWLQELY